MTDWCTARGAEHPSRAGMNPTRRQALNSSLSHICTALTAGEAKEYDEEVISDD